MTRAKQVLNCREHCPEAVNCASADANLLIENCSNGGPTKRLFGLLGLACESELVNPFAEVPIPPTHEDEAYNLIARSMTNGYLPY